MTLSTATQPSSFSSPSPHSPTPSLSSLSSMSISLSPLSSSSLDSSSTIEFKGVGSTETYGSGAAVATNSIAVATGMSPKGKPHPAQTKNGAKRNAYKHVPHCLKPAHLVAKRNARERTRVQAVNSAFGKLRKHVPYEAKHKRLSKVKTLRLAIEYIHHLQELLHNHDLQTSGRCLGLSGLTAEESPALSRARRRAKICDTRFPPCPTDTGISILSQACSPIAFERQPIHEYHAHYDPQNKCKSNAVAGLSSGHPTMLSSGDGAVPLPVFTAPTSIDAQGHYNHSQTHTTHTHYIDTYVCLDNTGGHSRSKFPDSDSSGNEFPTKKSQVPDYHQNATTFQSKPQENCLYYRNTLGHRSTAMQEYTNSSFRPIYQVSPPPKPGIYHHRGACCRQQTDIADNSAHCNTGKSVHPPQTLSKNIGAHSTPYMETTVPQNFLCSNSVAYNSFMVERK